MPDVLVPYDNRSEGRCPNGIFDPWARWDGGLDPARKFFRRRRRPGVPFPGPVPGPGPGPKGPGPGARVSLKYIII